MKGPDAADGDVVDDASGSRSSELVSVRRPCFFTGILMDFRAYRSWSWIRLFTRLMSATYKYSK